MAWFVFGGIHDIHDLNLRTVKRHVDLDLGSKQDPREAMPRIRGIIGTGGLNTSHKDLIRPAYLRKYSPLPPSPLPS